MPALKITAWLLKGPLAYALLITIWTVAFGWMIWDSAVAYTEARLDRAEQQSDASHNQNARRDEQDSLGLPLSPGVLPMQSGPEPQDAKETDSERQDKGDWGRLSAVAGLRANGLSFLGLVLTGFGLYYIRGTLRASNAATAAALKSIDVAQKIGMDQSRAYLCVEKITIFEGDDAPGFLAHVVNIGATPAKWFEIRVSCAIQTEDSSVVKVRMPDLDTPTFRYSAISGSVAQRAAIMDRGAEMSLLAAFVDNAAGNTVFVTGFVRYCTIYNEILRTDFGFSITDDAVVDSHDAGEPATMRQNALGDGFQFYEAS